MTPFTIERLRDPDALVVAFYGAFSIVEFLAAVRAAYADPARAALDSIWDYTGIDDRAVVGPEDVPVARAELARLRPDDRGGRTVFVVAGPNVALMAELYCYIQRGSTRRYDVVGTSDEAIALLQRG